MSEVGFQMLRIEIPASPVDLFFKNILKAIGLIISSTYFYITTSTQKYKLFCCRHHAFLHEGKIFFSSL